MLDGLTLLTNYPDGTSETRNLERSELPKILTEVFDIELSEADMTKLVHEPWPSDHATR
jgi:N-hydroxyarylamine O-acetyltransferase